MTDFGHPFIGSIKRVEDQWIDYNGHFNMAYYGVLFDRTGDEAFELVGLGPDYVKRHNASFFTLEAHFTYLRELAAGDSVKVTVQLLDYDAKRFHYVQEMYHASRRLARLRHGGDLHACRLRLEEVDAASGRSAGQARGHVRGPQGRPRPARGRPPHRHHPQDGLTALPDLFRQSIAHHRCLFCEGRWIWHARDKRA